MATTHSSEPVSFDPVLTKDQVFDGEQGEEACGSVRRTALLMLTRDSDDLRSFLADGNTELFMDLVEKVQSYRERREGEMELLNVVEARLIALLGEVVPMEGEA